MIVVWALFSVCFFSCFFTFLASKEDLKTGYINDIHYQLMILIGAVVWGLVSFVLNDQTYFINSFLTGGCCFIAGEIMYLLKAWGGGDAKLLVGLGFLFPFAEQIVLYICMSIFMYTIIWTIKHKKEKGNFGLKENCRGAPIFFMTSLFFVLHFLGMM